MKAKHQGYAEGGHFTQTTEPQQPAQLEDLHLNGGKMRNGLEQPL